MMEVMAKSASPRERKAAQLIREGCTGEIQAKREEMAGQCCKQWCYAGSMFQVLVGVLKGFCTTNFLVSSSPLVSWDPSQEAISARHFVGVPSGRGGCRVTGNGEGKLVMARAKGVARWTGCFVQDTHGLTTGLLS